MTQEPASVPKKGRPPTTKLRANIQIRIYRGKNYIHSSYLSRNNLTNDDVETITTKLKASL